MAQSWALQNGRTAGGLAGLASAQGPGVTYATPGALGTGPYGLGGVVNGIGGPGGMLSPHQYAGTQEAVRLGGFGHLGQDLGPQVSMLNPSATQQSIGQLTPPPNAQTGNPALDAYNAKLGSAIGRERFWDQAGLKGPVLGLMNFGAPGAAYLKGNKDSFLLDAALSGEYATPYQAQLANLGRIDGALDNYHPYSAQMVDMPTAIALNAKQNNETRGMQMGNLGVLKDASLGNGPSAAMGVLQRSTDANIAQQASLAASQRGGNAAAAQLQSRNNAVGIQQQSGLDATILRAQEMQAARELYTGALQGARGQDQNWAFKEADVGLANNQQKLAAQTANQQAGLSANGQNNAYYAQLLGLDLQGQTANSQASYQAASLNQEAELARLQAQLQKKAMDDANWQASMARKGNGFARSLPVFNAAGSVAQGVGSMFTGFASLGGKKKA